MNNPFTINYGPFQFILSKRDVSFTHGLGIVRVYYGFEGIIELVGVVDQHFQLVLPLQPAKNVSFIYPSIEGNIIYSYYDDVHDSSLVLQRDSFGSIKNLGAYTFSVIDSEDRNIILKFDRYDVLYDIVEEKYLTPFFSYIGPFVFSEKYGCLVARAFYYDQDSSGKVIHELSIIISSQGKVLANYEDLASGKFYQGSGISDVLALCRKNGDCCERN